MTRTQHSTRPTGFTLVEIVAAIVLFGIIGAMVSRVIGQSFNSYVIGRNVAETDWQARVVVERLTRELRAIRAPSDIIMTSTSDLSFIDAEGNTIRYCAGAVGTCPGATGELMRNAQVLANGVSGLTFSYLSKTAVVTAVPAQVYYVTVTFTATQGAISKNYQIAVSPRNFP